MNTSGDASTTVGVGAGSVGVGGAAGGGLGTYGHNSQDYSRAGRDVYHAQQPMMASPLTSSMPETQGRPSSNSQTQLYNPVAVHPTTSQYDSSPAQAVEGLSSAGCPRLVEVYPFLLLFVNRSIQCSCAESFTTGE